MAEHAAGRLSWRRDWRVWGAVAALLAIALVEVLILWRDDDDRPRGLTISLASSIRPPALKMYPSELYRPEGLSIVEVERELPRLRAALCRSSRREARQDGHVDPDEARRIESLCGAAGL